MNKYFDICATTPIGKDVLTFINKNVQDIFGNPVDDALITLLPRFGTTPTSVYSDNEGKATFDI